MTQSILLLSLCVAMLFPGYASAETSPEASAQDIRSYAIVVGNNAAGSGQEALQYAEADAKRMLAVLSQLGNYDQEQSILLLSPTPSALWNAFDKVHSRLEEDRRLGLESVLFFYYSGHARSTALDLGSLRVSLTDLRARIEGMPASLRVVVLDACQSGAISQVKGATAARDFSTNSITSLSMTGLAIMASSTGAELSQESNALKGSYFTHHLVAGLRGAADRNADGAVSLKEAYQYAYHTTLLTTAVSAVGKQHATLETNLRGKGQVALTRTSASDAKIKLPDSIGGAYTVSQNNTVIAEINKPAGQSTTIALPAGDYSVVVRTSAQHARRCSVKLVNASVTNMNWPSCTQVAIVTGTEKSAPGETYARLLSTPEKGAQWGVEVGVDLRGFSGDSYTERLETFGYQRDERLLKIDVINAHFQLKAYRRMGRYFVLGGSFGRLQSESYRRHTDGASTYNLNWSTWHASALGRIQTDSFGDLWQLYAEASLGLSRAKSTLGEEQMDRVANETYYGFAASGSIGAILMPSSYFGLVAGVGYGISPTLSNELGETYQGAGFVTNLGLRTTF